MSSPFQLPGQLLSAQIISYAKGQENQSQLSSEKRERNRIYLQQLRQAEQQHLTQDQTASSEKGMMA